jgi:hypothetical protein
MNDTINSDTDSYRTPVIHPTLSIPFFKWTKSTFPVRMCFKSYCLELLASIRDAQSKTIGPTLRENDIPSTQKLAQPRVERIANGKSVHHFASYGYRRRRSNWKRTGLR